MILITSLTGCKNSDEEMAQDKFTQQKQEAALPKTGYAILIGIDRVDPTKYDGDNLEFLGSSKDILGIKVLLNTSKCFDSNNIHVHHKIKTNWSDLLLTLNDVQSKTKNKNEYVFIYFTGHGGLLDTKQKKAEQVLCFSDRMVLKKEFLKQLQLFSKGTKIYVLIDACYSGDFHEETKAIPRRVCNSIYENNFLSTYQSLDKFFSFKFKPKADICFTTATKDRHGTTGMNGNQQSVFTAKYISRWDNDMCDNYQFIDYTKFRNDEKFFLNTHPLIFK